MISGEIAWCRGDVVLGKTQAYYARTFWSRFRGLLACSPLKQDQGLVIKPCGSIHTFFMGYAIDVVFISKENRVLRVVAAVVPWRGCYCPQANYVVELAEGAAARLNLKKGDLCQCR